MPLKRSRPTETSPDAYVKPGFERTIAYFEKLLTDTSAVTKQNPVA